MIVICSYSYSQSLLSVPAVTSNHSGLLHKRYFLFLGVKKENCQNRCRSAEVTSISFPSTRRESRNKECPLIEVMTFIPWMHGSEVQLIDSVSWQSCLIWSHKGKKKNEGETFELKLQAALSLSGLWKCRTFCITVWKLHSGNVRMKCFFVAGETSKWDVKGTVSFCPCERAERQKETNGGNRVDERELSLHHPSRRCKTSDI